MALKFNPTKAIVALATLAVVMVIGSTTALLLDLRKRQINHANLETVSLTQMFTAETDQNFSAIDQVLQAVQERIQSSYGSQFTLDSQPVHLLLRARVTGSRLINRMFIVSPEGEVTNTSMENLTHLGVQNRDYFQAFKHDPQLPLFIDKPVSAQVDGELALHLARPLLSADGQLRGIVVAEVSLTSFEKLYNLVNLEYARPVSILMADGSLIASMPHRANLIGAKVPEMSNETLPGKGGAVRIFDHRSGNGDRMVYAVGPVPHYPLLVSVANEVENTLAVWRETAIPIGLGAIMVSVLIGLAAATLVHRLKSEEALSSELNAVNDRYQHTINSVMDAIVAVNKDHEIVLFNPAAERMFGISSKQAMNQPLQNLIPERLREPHTQHLHRFRDQPQRLPHTNPHIKIIGLRADGVEFPIESAISRTLVNGQVQFTTVLRDVTEQRQAEASLQEMNQQLRTLSATLQSVREKERGRISRELHDDLGQQLTGLKLDLSWLGSRIKDGRGAEVKEIDAMRQQLDGAIASVRRISSELRPPILDDLGFVEAVTWHVAELSKRSGLSITLNMPAGNLVRNEDVVIALYRIVQEALTNIVRHAQAEHAQISLLKDGEDLVLQIDDDGCGLKPGPNPGGIGMLSMRERATELGGQFTVKGSDSRGFHLEVRLPMSALRDDAEVST